jgi:hypothetical protein
MIFTNPSGAPELACDECGCRWFDRRGGTCYECGAPITPEAQDEFRRAIEAHAAARRAAQAAAEGSKGGGLP